MPAGESSAEWDNKAKRSLRLRGDHALRARGGGKSTRHAGQNQAFPPQAGESSAEWEDKPKKLVSITAQKSRAHSKRESHRNLHARLLLLRTQTWSGRRLTAYFVRGLSVID